MLRKQLLFALRRLGRHKLTTTINVLGLTLGVLSCLVIYLYVGFEFSFDKFHPDGNRIYRVLTTFDKADGTHSEGPWSPAPLATDMRRECTGFSAVAGLYTVDTRVIIPEAGKPDRSFPGIQEGDRHHITFADQQYLDIFHYQWLAGNPAAALKAPFAVVLTESAARRYFQSGNPTDWMGRSVIYYDSLTVTVAGVVKDWQHNSDFGFTDIISYPTIEHSFLGKDMDGWNLYQTAANTYVKLSPGTTVAQAEKQFPAFHQQHSPADKGEKRSFRLQPLADIHFNGEMSDFYGRRAHKPTLYALAGIALFILLIASINFVNLSTAQAVLRSKEVGVRKVLGSSRGGLVWQFLSETGVIVVSAMILSLLLVNPVLAALNGFIPDGVRLRLSDPGVWLFIAATVMVTCLLAGWYPARALSAFLPVISLRGQGSQQLNSKSYLRKALIVFQFTVSLLFIIGTIMVGRQMHYVLNTDLGFKKDAIVTLRLPGDQPRNLKGVLATEVRKISGVQQVCLSTNSPAGRGHGGTYLYYKGTTETKLDATFDQIDTGYIPLYGLTLVAGRNFNLSDTFRRGVDADPAKGIAAVPWFRTFIINESAAKALGFRNPADAVGHQVSTGFGGVLGPVLGVVKDFHSESLHEKIEPFFLTTQQGAGSTLSVKVASANLSAGQVHELIEKMQTTFKKVYPNSVFDPHFFDEMLAKQYATDEKTAQILNLAMGIAIFISCMGLFGLAAFTANQRTREFGIRKVLGAGVPHLVSLLSREFLVLVGLSVLIAAPIAYWAMNEWLQDFAYRTTMPWWIYVLSGVAAVAIALLTVSFQAVRAATANPVDSLRSE